jgi:hypothetical protein
VSQRVARKARPMTGNPERLEEKVDCFVTMLLAMTNEQNWIGVSGRHARPSCRASTSSFHSRHTKTWMTVTSTAMTNPITSVVRRVASRASALSARSRLVAIPDIAVFARGIVRWKDAVVDRAGFPDQAGPFEFGFRNKFDDIGHVVP